MRRTHGSPHVTLSTAERLRVADFLLLLITIDRRLTAQMAAARTTARTARVARTAKASETVPNKQVRDIGSRSSRALFIVIELFLYFELQRYCSFFFLGVKEIFIEYPSASATLDNLLTDAVV